MKPEIPALPADDAELVRRSLLGGSDAFAEIVRRYQSLVCSVAYNSVGSVATSEDVAQETFVAAWRQLGSLREPARLRSWLCGIARNLTSDAARKQGREPSHGAEPLENAGAAAAPGESVPQQAVSREEEAILWRAIEHIPVLYREPLILFYRQHQSVARVAEALEISEDVAKQRLSRGRKMLQEKVVAFVEGTLERTNPSDGFTQAVLAVLPLGGPTKMGLGVKAAGLGALGAFLAPILGVAAGFAGTWMSVRGSQSERERQWARKWAWVNWGVLGTFFFCLSLALPQFRGRVTSRAGIGALVGASLLLAAGFVILNSWAFRRQMRIRREAAASGHVDRTAAPEYEYRSRWTLLGLPLVHVRLNSRGDGNLRAATGWIAMGSIARGVLVAFGARATGLIAVGGVAVGGFAVGGCAIGVVSVGFLAVGGWAVGGAAVGYVAAAAISVGWLGAGGGAALARDFAVGGLTWAAHPNDSAAREFATNNAFFQNFRSILNAGVLLAIVPLALALGRKRLIAPESPGA